MNYISTRNNQINFSSEQVLNYGLAPDGGLFIPREIPKFSISDIKNLKNANYQDIAYFVLNPFLKDLFSVEEIKQLISDAYQSFDEGIVSITELGENQLLNLFHGPTLAFKDYAMCLLAKIYELYLRKKNQKLVILGATSGDTGSAAIHAFKGIRNIDIFILHPNNATSVFQRKQMTTSGADNVFNIALEGNFDDCQTLVKKTFNDQELNSRYQFTAINSINWFRILPQSIYYAWAYLNHSVDSFVVPSGNFGNIYSAHLLKSMGFPLRNLVIATNENNILHRIIANNDFSLTDVIKTNSPSMDITISSNFERILAESFNPEELSHLYKNIKNRAQNPKLDEKVHEQLSGKFKSEYATSDEVEKCIKKYFDINKVLIDPHTAVGVVCAEKMNLKNFMCLACAHPVKFQETVTKSLCREIEYDKTFEFKSKEHFEVIKNDYDLLKEFISNNA
jgi:threonine synthase